MCIRDRSLTSTVVPTCSSYFANPEPTYLGVASAHSASTATTSSAAEPVSVESIPLPVADRGSLPPMPSSAYSVPAELHCQSLYMHPHQQPSVIVHPGTSSSHPAHHSEPLELSVSSRGGESSTGDQSSRLRSPPAYDDLQASNNVCLDLTNPYRSAAAEVPTTVPGARTSSYETAS